LSGSGDAHGGAAGAAAAGPGGGECDQQAGVTSAATARATAEVTMNPPNLRYLDPCRARGELASKPSFCASERRRGREGLSVDGAREGAREIPLTAGPFGRMFVR